MAEPIVISGITGRFPESNNLEEFWKHLLEGIDMVTLDSRRNHADGPIRAGTLKADLTKFDNTFFGIHAKQAEKMDPAYRILHEVVFEAIMDAGVNPVTLRGSNVGVFIGATDSPTHSISMQAKDQTSRYDLTGSVFGMAANRISYAFDFKGPSYTLDTLCSSSMLALNNALQAIRMGHCETAIVGGSNLILQPGFTVQVNKAGALSADGKCKSYDKEGDGYVRSEAIVAVFLQRKKEALRSYATLVHSKTSSNGFNLNGISSPSGSDQQILMEQVYQEAGVDPRNVFYVEGHGTGTAAGDPEELNAITSVFLPGRSLELLPLLVGSVKSNMGHPEAASGLCSIAKVLLALENRLIPGNLHYRVPNPSAPALVNGQLKVVSENMPINVVMKKKLVSLNSSGFGGSNVHVILEAPEVASGYKTKVNLPELILFSGTSESSVTTALEKVHNGPKDRGFEMLLQNIFKTPIPDHGFRGFTIIGGSSALVQAVAVPRQPSPIWFIFSGMGTVYKGMFNDLMDIKPFADSVATCNEVLSRVGLNVFDLMDSDDDKILNKHMGVLFATMQTSLVDIVEALGIHADGMIGHSAGELICGYADKCVTKEQVLLMAHYKDLCAEKCSGGAMGAIGLTWEEACAQCPTDVFPACHNDKNSVTVAGPFESVQAFVSRLTGQGVFARLIDAGGVAYHSPYLEPILDQYENYIKSILEPSSGKTRPNSRSSKWVSTCVPTGMEQAPEYQLAGPAYFLANLRDPVRFYEATHQIPENALIFEISSHALFVSLLRKSLPNPSALIGLMRKGNGNNRVQILSAIGQLYLHGVNPDLLKIATAGNDCEDRFPVPPGTRMIAPLIQWDTGNSFELMDYNFASSQSSETSIKISLGKDEFNYLYGHKIDSRLLFPAAGYLELVWSKLAAGLGKSGESICVEFSDVRFENALVLHQDTLAQLEVSLATRRGGQFQICTGDGLLLVHGKVSPVNSDQIRIMESSQDNSIPRDAVTLTQEDFYKLVRLSGYEYDGIFKGVKSANDHGGKLEWKGNWVAFLDAMIQLQLLRSENKIGYWNSLKVPTSIRSIVINPAKFLAEGTDEEYLVTVQMNKVLDTTFCPGIQIHQVKLNVIPRKVDQVESIIEEYKFVPYFEDEEVGIGSSMSNWEDTVKYFMDIVLENTTNRLLRIEEDVDKLENSIAELVIKSVTFHHKRDVTISIKSEEHQVNPESVVNLEAKYNAISICKANRDTKRITADVVITNSVQYLQSVNGPWEDISDSPEFIIYHTEAMNKQTFDKEPQGYHQVARKTWFQKRVVLYKKTHTFKEDPVLIFIHNDDLDWIQKLKDAIATAAAATIATQEDADASKLMVKDDIARIYVISTETYSGIFGFLNCLRLEHGGQYVRCISSVAPLDSNTISTFGSIFQHDLAMTCLDESGKLGSYRHLSLWKSQTIHTRQAYVNCGTKGDLSSLKFYESSPYQMEHCENVCEVQYAGLNFRDVLLTIGQLPPEAIPRKLRNLDDCLLGLEFSGTRRNGENVMGIVECKGLATYVVSEPRFTWGVPESWSLKEAATVPVAYATAYYALILRGNLQKGQSILIHSGSGGVGQAAISIALSLDCRVFTSVGSQEKREFLLNHFPNLSAGNVLHSRDTSFEQNILSATNGIGVDMVLNSLSEDKLHASIRCLAAGGKFMEIGKYDFSKNNSLGMEIFLKNVSFHGILLDSLFDDSNPEALTEAGKVHQLVSDGIDSGIVTPLPATAFSRGEVEKAFRFMANGKHVGKVLIHMKESENSSGDQLIEAEGMTYFDPSKVYIVVGGLGGFGFEMAKWMVERGCKKVVLVSRSGVKSGYQSWTIEAMTRIGVIMKISNSDISTLEGARQLLLLAIEFGRIGGIFNLAMDLKDRKFQNQTEEVFLQVLKPKYFGTLHLDVVSRELCPNLEYFVVFSSYSAGRGVFGQTNYGFANSTMERICERRRKDGLAGLAIQWGAIGDVGVVYDKMGGNECDLHGLIPQRLGSCLNALNRLLRRRSEIGPIVTSWLKASEGTQGRNQQRGEAKAINVPGIYRSLVTILGLKEPPSNLKLRLTDHGMDSLMVVEAKQLIESHAGKVFTMEQIRELTWENLGEIEAGLKK